MCYERLGDKEKAAADFAGAIEISSKLIDIPATPPDTMVMALDGRSYDELLAGASDKAIEDARRCLALSPRDYTAAYNLGTMLLMAGKFAEARTAYEAALPLHTPLGSSGAEIDLIDLRDLGQAPPETTVFLGWIYLKAGKRDLATAELKKYLADHADGPLAGWAKELVASSPK